MSELEDNWYIEGMKVVNNLLKVVGYSGQQIIIVPITLVTLICFMPIEVSFFVAVTYEKDYCIN